MKNALRIIAVVVVAALLFGIGFSLGSSKGITISVKYSDSASGSTGTPGGAASTPVASPSTQQPTEAPTQTPTADAPADDNTDAPAPSDDKKPADSDNNGGVPGSKTEIIDAYNKAISKTKAIGTVNVTKASKINISVTDCSIAIAKPLLNPIVQKFLNDSTTDFSFVDGKDTNSDKTLNDLVPPSNREPSLKDEYTANASATPAGDGYTITINLVSETSTFDGTNTVKPAANESIIDPLNLATLDISPAKIASANMSYSGSTVEATVNGNGTLDKLVVKIPMEGNGSGQISRFTVDVGLAGDLEDTYTFTY